jgi:hypothetical protein
MRAAIALAFALVVAAVTTATPTAHAGPERAAPSYSYELDAEPPAGKVLVVWPRACSASGEPLGNVDLALNPDWTARMNDVDYEVIVRGKTHALAAPCLETARIYALPADAFPAGTRPATADDVSIGAAEAGTPLAMVPALDAIDRKKRIELFEKDPRIGRPSFRFDVAKGAAAGASAVHEVLAVEGAAGDAAGVVVRTVRAVYTYEDGGRETVAASAGASTEARARADAGAAMGASASAGSEKHDLGTRWVLLAALAGLLAGGGLAYSRKKRDGARK